MKEVFVERLTYANSKQHSAVQAENVPPIIAPSLRSATVFNTELQKKSVYLKGKFFEKDKINGKLTLCTFVRFICVQFCPLYYPSTWCKQVNMSLEIPYYNPLTLKGSPIDE